MASLFSDKNYRWWFTADTSSVIAGSLNTLALSLLAFELTHSPTLVGLLTTVSMLTDIALTLPGGVIVDRHRRTTLMRIRGGALCITWALVVILLWTGWLQYWMLFAAVVITAIIAGLLDTAADATLRSIVAPSEYASARTITQGRNSAISATFQPLTGILYHLANVLPFLVSTISSAILFFSSGRIKEDYTPKDSANTTFIKDLSEGFSYIWGRPVIRRLLIVACVVNFGLMLLNSAVNIYLISVDTPPVLIGLVASAMGVGAIIGAFIAGFIVKRIGTGKIIVFSFVWMLICIIPLLFNHSYGAICLCLFLSALVVPSLNATLDGFLFAQIPHELQGRAASVLLFMAGALVGIAPLLAGVIIQKTTLEAALIPAVVITVLATIMVITSKRIRSIPKPDQWVTHVDDMDIPEASRPDTPCPDTPRSDAPPVPGVSDSCTSAPDGSLDPHTPDTNPN